MNLSPPISVPLSGQNMGCADLGVNSPGLLWGFPADRRSIGSLRVGFGIALRVIRTRDVESLRRQVRRIKIELVSAHESFNEQSVNGRFRIGDGHIQ